jgi:sialate O-acetylesterase
MFFIKRTRSMPIRPIASCCFFLLAAPSLPAEVTPACFFTEHAVVQADVPLPVWGTADPGKRVTVSYAGASAETMADAAGKWRVVLPAFPAGTRGTMTFNQTTEVKDVVAGEVWFCSGQSNMYYPLRLNTDAAGELATATDPDIRHFQVPANTSATPLDDTSLKDAAWKAASPETAGDFTATGYFFACELRRALRVPVGLIHASWGGTAIEPWIPGSVLEKHPGYPALLERKRLEIAGWPDVLKESARQIAEWESQVAKAKTEGKTPPAKPWLPDPPESGHRMPSQLFNGMVHPVTAFPLRGSIWYQGESNADQGIADYADFQATLIRGWREAWNVGAFPFYFVQLPNWKNPYDPTGRNWAFFREAQAKTPALVDKSGMIVTLDLGDPEDIHPQDKRALGLRLARLALADTYGKPFITRAPSLQKWEVAGNRVLLDFGDAAKDLVTRGDELTGFEIAAADGVFQTARAVRDDGIIAVSHSDMAAPAHVRYAWTNSPVPSLFHRNGLPVAPFRTDSLK